MGSILLSKSPSRRAANFATSLLVALCLTLPAAAETPSVIVNYDVLNSLGERPSQSGTPAIGRDQSAGSVFAEPESRLLVKPKKPKRRVKPLTVRKTPTPRSKPLLVSQPSAAEATRVDTPATASRKPEAQTPDSTAAARTEATPPAPSLQAPVAESAEAPTASPLPAAPPPPPDAPDIAGLIGGAQAAENDPLAAPLPEAPKPVEAPIAATPEQIAKIPDQPSSTAGKTVPRKEAAAEVSPETSKEPATEAGTAEALRILFDLASAELSDIAKAALSDLAESLKSESGSSVVLRGHAAGTSGNARRTSLNRARAVRSFLVDKGVASTRIDVQPLGATSKGGPPDRVDIVFARR